MKAIFLDFDGVIRIPVFTGGPKPEAEYCVERTERVAGLAERYQAEVVISSDWRLHKSRGEIVSVIGPIAKYLHSDWQTVDLCGCDKEDLRGFEIQAWLNDHNDTESFIILDDYPPEVFPGLADRLVRCNLLDGFNEEKFQEAESLFRFH